jgi:hypothetical protein
MCGGRPSYPAPTPPPAPPPPIVTPITPVTEGQAAGAPFDTRSAAAGGPAVGTLGDSTNKVTQKTLLGA